MAATREQLKEQFKKFDKDGSNSLDLEEMSHLLNEKGKGKLTKKQLKDLFNGVDKNGDGVVQFDEFLDYIYSTQKSTDKRSGDARRQKYKEQEENDDAGDEALWGQVEVVFGKFVGADCDGREFQKLCKECTLFCKKFTKTDADLLFSKFVPKGKRMVFDDFQKAVAHIAKKKGKAVADVQGMINEHADGPHFSGTKADAVRFHDDKSTYTGAHVSNANHGSAGGGERDSASRHDRLHASGEQVEHGNEEMWGKVEEVFENFLTAGHSDIDGKDFGKICVDCSLFDKKFKKEDEGVVFSGSVTKGARRMNFEQFKMACGKIAKKKGCPVEDIQQKLTDAGGPHLHGATKADAVRFHDDKDTYTGSHFGK